MKNLNRLPIYAGVVAAAMGLPAHAQKIAESVGNLSVEEIIVTARKTEESIQDIPFSIQAVSDKQIAQRDYRGLEDIARATPGLTFEGFSQGGASANAVMRGLTNTYTTARVQNVSVFLNGIYLQRQGMINSGLLDVQRVEILKGPQSALFGRNAFSGAINYITAEPSDIFGGKVSVTVGDNERRDYKGTITGEIVEDLVSAKFSYNNSTYDGHTQNYHPNADANPAGFNTKDDLGGWEDEAFSLGLRIKPREDFEVALDWYHTDLAHENEPYYTIRGANYAYVGLNAEVPVTGGIYNNDEFGSHGCNNTTLAAGSGFYSGSGNTLWCGRLPSSKPGNNGKYYIDPRTTGTLSKTDVVSLKLSWEINDDWSSYYLYGSANHKTRTSGGADYNADGTGGAWFTQNITTVVQTQFGPPIVTITPGARDNVTSWNGTPNANLDADSHELRFEWAGNDLVSGSFGMFYSKVEDANWDYYYFTSVCNGDPANIANCNISLADSPSALRASNTGTTTVQPNTPGFGQSRTTALVNSAAFRNGMQHGIPTGLTAYEDEIYSVFGTLSFVLTDDLTLQLEGRYTQENKEVENINDAQGLAYGAAPFVGYAGPGGSVTSTIVNPHVSDKFYFFAPRASLQWQVAADNLVYFTIAKGEKTGGFNNTADASQQTYDPETNWTYELGSKNTFLDNTVQLNASLYYIDWKDIQGGSSPADPNAFFASAPITNIGGGENMGIEVDGLWNISENWSVDGAFALNDPKYKDAIYVDAYTKWQCDTPGNNVCPADGDIDGNQIFRTSKRQASFGATYRTVVFDGWGLSARLEGAYQGKQYADPLNLASISSRTTYNANINFQAPNNWEVSFWGKNIFDKEYTAAAFLIAQFNQYIVNPGARRSFGATVTYNFE